MSLVSFGEPGGEQPGLLADNDTVIPLREPLGNPDLDMNDVLQLLSEVPTRLGALVDGGVDAIPLESIRLGPPVPHPGAIIAVGANYIGHLQEQNAQPPKQPMLFAKPVSSVAGPYDAIQRPPETRMLDYEIELAVVIGRPGRRISKDAALGHVAGYMIANDVTARDVFLGESHTNPLFLQILRGKGFDTFCPTGPWLVTADEILDPSQLRLQLSINNEPRQDGGCDEMIFDVPTLIASASECFTLRAGDILLTGTPSGVGIGRQPPEFLQAGDQLELQITNLGIMRTPVVDELAQPG